MSTWRLDNVFLHVSHTNLGYDQFRPNVKKCFERIAYDGGWEPTLQTLTDIHRCFLLTFPYENLSIHGLDHLDSSDSQYDSPISLDPNIIEAKLLDSKRGGYCFELNHYLYFVLRELGFSVVTKGARVLWSYDPRESRPRTHICILCRFPSDALYLCDIAFGGNSFMRPLSMDVGDAPQTTVYDTHRLLMHTKDSSRSHRFPDDHVLVQVLHHEADEWLDLYVFDMNEMSTVADWDAANYVTATRPSVSFKQRIMMSLTTPSGRNTLVNTRLTQRTLDPGIQDANGRARSSLQHTELQTAQQFFDCLERHFNVAVPKDKQASMVIPGAPEGFWSHDEAGTIG